jgi:predicted amidohydrolase YtcJ
MRELNGLGVTSVVDAGGGFQNYPDDYEIIDKLHADGHLTLRIAYNLFTQRAGGEFDDFSRWTKAVKPGQGDDTYRVNGAGEMLVYSAADFEDFREPRPEMPPTMEADLERVVLMLAQSRWPWRLHATYNETIERALNVFEKVNREVPFDGLHWFFDHAETITQKNIDRIAVLGGGIAVQHRMAFQGEYYIDRYGQKSGETTPPISNMLSSGVPVGAGTDATRVASYNPWVSLAWLVTGKTVGGAQLYPASNRVDREQALRLWTEANTWFSNEQGKKGRIAVGELADLAVLSDDYFKVAESEIAHLSSVMTLLGGRVVYAKGDFADLGPPSVPVLPDWSPVKRFGGYQQRRLGQPGAARMTPLCGCSAACTVHGHDHVAAAHRNVPTGDAQGFWGAFGCGCWAV